jgi:hypothetical protein
MSIRTKRTSKEWQVIFPEIVVIDPDGWDRKNFDYSWNEEKIGVQEYFKRRLLSSCKSFSQVFAGVRDEI